MRDRFYCKNKKCRRKLNCKRYNAKPNIRWPKYLQVQVPKDCAYYLPIDSQFDFSKKVK